MEEKKLEQIVEEHVEPYLASNPLPSFSLPANKDKPTVEVAPGVLVAQHLIDEAVGIASAGETPQDHIDYYQRARVKEALQHAEIRRDMDASRQFVQAMVDRMLHPMDPEEKYVSFDAMPKPLQRVVKAYIEVESANRELNEAIASLSGAPVPEAAAKAPATKKGLNEDSQRWVQLAGLGE